MTATGNPTPKITKAGRLPSGVTFTANGNGTATISGTPAHRAAGRYPLILTARNKAGIATQNFTLTITKPPAIKKIRTTRAVVGTPLNLHIRATGYPDPVLAEPSGLTFADDRNGAAILSGTPTPGSEGCYRVTIIATNASGTATLHFMIIVSRHRRLVS